jgi:ribulose bisphosphate carboxylase small subunit
MDIIEQLDLLISQGYKRNKNYVYILELQDNKYYVGKTYDFIHRILAHTLSKNATQWTKLYKPIKILELLSSNIFIILLDEEYMRLYGWQNVRGYTWSKVIMKNPPKEL